MTEAEDFPGFTTIPDPPISHEKLFQRATFMFSRSRSLGHSGYIGSMDSMPTTISIAGAIVAAAKNNMLAEEMAELRCATLEDEAVRRAHEGPKSCVNLSSTIIEPTDGF
jgi:hypothetical protein